MNWLVVIGIVFVIFFIQFTLAIITDAVKKHWINSQHDKLEKE